MMPTKKRVLITGASGYIGSNLLESLLVDSSFELHATYYTGQGIQNQKIQWHRINLLNTDERQKLVHEVNADYLVHLAWKVAPQLKLDLKEYAEWVEVSKSLVQEFYESGGLRAVLTGTCAEYDWNEQLLRENSTALKPNNLYGEQKKELFEFMNKYCTKNNLSWVWIRLFFSFGPHQNVNSLVPSVIRSFLDNKELKTTEGLQEFDYIYIKDMVLAIKKLIDHTFVGPINVCSGETTKLKDIVLKLKELMSPTSSINFGALPYPKSVPMKILGSNDLIAKTLGWKPIYSFESALNETIQSLKE